MELTITQTVYIDIDSIIANEGSGWKLTADDDDTTIEEAVRDYVAGLDDSEFYLIGEDEIDKIVAEIKTKLVQ